MEQAQDFPVLIHVITVPLTLGLGFLLGWVIRGVASQPPGRPRTPPPPPGS